LEQHATSVILGHNQLSGAVTPSEADNKNTKKIKDCGLLLDVAVLDQIIVGDDRF
jgi:DNA repair protein RadC